MSGLFDTYNRQAISEQGMELPLGIRNPNQLTTSATRMSDR